MRALLNDQLDDLVFHVFPDKNAATREELAGLSIDQLGFAFVRVVDREPLSLDQFCTVSLTNGPEERKVSNRVAHSFYSED